MQKNAQLLPAAAWVWGEDNQLSYKVDSDRIHSSPVTETSAVWESPAIHLRLQSLSRSASWAFVHFVSNSVIPNNNNLSTIAIRLIRKTAHTSHSNTTNTSITDAAALLVPLETDTTPHSQSNVNLKVLMSILQKNVRLQRQTSAVRTAWKTLQQGPRGVTELLRRLPIIIVEDATVQPEFFSHLIWLMMADSKGYQLSPFDVQLILTAVYDSCAPFAVCDMRCKALSQCFQHYLSNFAKSHTVSFYLEKSTSTNSKTKQISVLDLLPTVAKQSTTQTSNANTIASTAFALLARSAYGGMPGDVEMLGKACFFWNWRERVAPLNASTSILESNQISLVSFIQNKSRSVNDKSDVNRSCSMETLKTLIAIIAIPFSVDSDAPLTSIDMHCSNILNDFSNSDLGKQFGFCSPRGYSELSHCIWDYRSSLTTRKCWHCNNTHCNNTPTNVEATSVNSSGNNNNSNNNTSTCWDREKRNELTAPSWWRELHPKKLDEYARAKLMYHFLAARSPSLLMQPIHQNNNKHLASNVGTSYVASTSVHNNNTNNNTNNKNNKRKLGSSFLGKVATQTVSRPVKMKHEMALLNQPRLTQFVVRIKSNTIG
jgi:hypothetical protein